MLRYSSWFHCVLDLVYSKFTHYSLTLHPISREGMIIHVQYILRKKWLIISVNYSFSKICAATARLCSKSTKIALNIQFATVYCPCALLYQYICLCVWRNGLGKDDWLQPNWKGSVEQWWEEENQWWNFNTVQIQGRTQNKRHKLPMTFTKTGYIDTKY